MQVEERINYQQLSDKVGNDNEIQSALKEGYELLLKVRHTPELYTKFQKEYHELYISIKNAFENDKKFSQEERAKIMFELSDIVHIAQTHGIVEKKGTMSKLGDWWKGTNTNEVKAKAQGLREKNIKDFSPQEAISAMNYLNNNYQKYTSTSGDDTLSKAQRGVSQLLGNYSSLNELDNQHEVRLFQDELAKKIFGDGKGFNKTHVLGFNNEKGNFLVSIEDFEKKLKENSIKDINSKALSNYFLSLEAKGELSSKKLVEVFGENNLLELKKLWLEKKDNFDDKKDIAKNILEQKGILKTILGLIEVFTSSDKLIKMLLENTNNPTPQTKEQEEVAMLFIKKNIKGIQDKMKADIKNKYLIHHPGEEKKAQEIADKLITELSTCKTKEDIPKVLKIFYNFSKNYGIAIEGKEQLEALFKLRELENNEGMIENSQMIRAKKEQLKQAKANKDSEQQKQLEQELTVLEKQQKQRHLQASDLKIAKKLAAKITPDYEKKLVEGGDKEFEAFETEMRKQDKELNTLYTTYEKQSQQYYISYPEEKLAQTKNSTLSPEDSQLKLDQNLSYGIHTITYDNGNSISYTGENGGYNLLVNNESISISKNELEVIQNSEKALENMIHFKETLDDLNLGGLWKYREAIFTGIRNSNLFSIDTQDDFINESEMIIFLRSILISIGISSNIPNNLDDIKGEIILINKGGIFNQQEEVNIYGDSFIESKFIQKFDPDRKQNAGMITQLFSESLQEKNIIG